jgi:simple sugar transport system ATP-binding protein
MVHQHFQLVPTLSVAENMLLGTAAPRLFLRRDQGHAALRALAAQSGLDVDPGAPLWSLSVGEKQRVEILKVLWRGARVLILDEPTAVLTPLEVQPFFDSVRRLAEGGSAVVLITHKLHEVLAVADRVTVLRRGRVVAAHLDARQTSIAALEAHILGEARAQPLVRPARPTATEGGPPRLQLVDVSAQGPRGERILHGVNLAVQAGEIVGVAGVSGNGQRELADLLLGLQAPLGGRILLDGRDLARASVAERRRRGLGLVPEDRLGQGAAPSLSVLRNLVQDRVLGARSLRLRWGELRTLAQERVQAHDVRLRSLEQVAGELSGGNLQKLILARELAAGPRALVVAQPTRGLDLGAAGEVRQRLIELASQGCAVLLISEDLDEVLALSHRIAVLYRGRVAGVVDAAVASAASIGRLMLGGEAAA